jgi:hypothetical protein
MDWWKDWWKYWWKDWWKDWWMDWWQDIQRLDALERHGRGQMREHKSLERMPIQMCGHTPVVGGIAPECDVEQLQELVHAGDQRLSGRMVGVVPMLYQPKT